jgi:hypothetical protein
MTLDLIGLSREIIDSKSARSEDILRNKSYRSREWWVESFGINSEIMITQAQLIARQFSNGEIRQLTTEIFDNTKSGAVAVCRKE